MAGILATRAPGRRKRNREIRGVVNNVGERMDDLGYLQALVVYPLTFAVVPDSHGLEVGSICGIEQQIAHLLLLREAWDEVERTTISTAKQKSAAAAFATGNSHQLGEWKA